MTPSTSSAYLDECPAGLSPSATDEFPAERAGVTGEWSVPAPASTTVDVHHVLRAVAAEFAGQVRSKRLDFSLRLLARNHYLQTSDPARFRAGLAGLVGRAIATAHAGARLTLRTSRPADCALRIEVEERSPWMRRAGGAAARASRGSAATTSSSSHVH